MIEQITTRVISIRPAQWPLRYSVDYHNPQGYFARPETEGEKNWLFRLRQSNYEDTLDRVVSYSLHSEGAVVSSIQAARPNLAETKAIRLSHQKPVADWSIPHTISSHPQLSLYEGGNSGQTTVNPLTVIM